MLLTLTLLSVALLLNGCGKEPAANSRPLLKVGERRIGKAEFDAAFSRTVKPGQEVSASERQGLARAFLTELVDRELVLAEARRQNLTVAPAEIDAALDEHRREYPAGGFEAMLQQRNLTLDEWRTELQENLLIARVTDQVVGAKARVGEMDIDAYYAGHRNEFDRPEQVRARQIVVATPAEGEAVLARLKRGEPFAAVAKTASFSPEAEQGGDLGFFGREEMPPEFATVFSLPAGKVSPLIKSDYGYHLFLVEEKRAAARLNRQEAEREIRKALEAERRETLYQTWIQELRGKTPVEIDWRQLEPNR